MYFFTFPPTPTRHPQQAEEDDIEAQLEAARRLNEELRRMELGESSGLLYEDIYGEGGRGLAARFFFFFK